MGFNHCFFRFHLAIFIVYSFSMSMAESVTDRERDGPHTKTDENNTMFKKATAFIAALNATRAAYLETLRTLPAPLDQVLAKLTPEGRQWLKQHLATVLSDGERRLREQCEQVVTATGQSMNCSQIVARTIAGIEDDLRRGPPLSDDSVRFQGGRRRIAHAAPAFVPAVASLGAWSEVAVGYLAAGMEGIVAIETTAAVGAGIGVGTIAVGAGIVVVGALAVGGIGYAIYKFATG